MNNDVINRLKELRSLLDLSQAKFAKKISISPGYIGLIELGERNINDRIMKLIVSEFNVNEEWLKTGQGNMFMDEKEYFLKDIQKRLGFDDFIMNFARKYASLSDEEKEIIKKFMSSL